MIPASEITDELKAEFIQLIYQGKKPDQAARDLDSTATQFRAHRSPKSQWHDEAFEAAYDLAIASDEHKTNFLEELRDAAWRKARNGDSQLLTKYLMVYDPDWEPLRHSNLRVDVNVKMLHEILPHIPRDQLEAAVQARERELKEPAPLKALPPAS